MADETTDVSNAAAKTIVEGSDDAMADEDSSADKMGLSTGMTLERNLLLRLTTNDFLIEAMVRNNPRKMISMRINCTSICIVTDNP